MDLKCVSCGQSHGHQTMPELLACSHCHGPHSPVLPISSLHSALVYSCLHHLCRLYSYPYHCSPAQNPIAYKVKHKSPILQATPPSSNPTHTSLDSPQLHQMSHMWNYAAHKPSWCLSHTVFSPFQSFPSVITSAIT